VASPVVIAQGARVTHEKILLASDGGAASAAALRWVIDHVGPRAADVTIVDVVDSAAADAQERRRSIQGMAALLGAVVPALHVTVPATDDAAALLAGSPDALLVVGAHRRDVMDSPLVERVLARTAGPVVVVPSEWIGRQGPVMVGIGKEEATSPALAFAEKEAAARRTGLRLIHTWETTGPGEIPPEWDFGTDSIPERQRRALAGLTRQAQQSHPELAITSEAIQGQLVATLRAAARTASLLVVGRSHRGAVTQALFGSSTKGLVAHLPCPIAVIP
jgi:nucleotide-binding universal stress UspA family protein